MIDRDKVHKDIAQAVQDAFTRRDTINKMVFRIVEAAVDSLIDEIEKGRSNGRTTKGNST